MARALPGPALLMGQPPLCVYTSSFQRMLLWMFRYMFQDSLHVREDMHGLYRSTNMSQIKTSLWLHDMMVMMSLVDWSHVHVMHDHSHMTAYTCTHLHFLIVAIQCINSTLPSLQRKVSSILFSYCM